MIILAVLKDWHVDTNEGKRGRPSTNKKRIILAYLDPKNYAVCVEHEGHPPIGQKFTDRLANLPFTARSYCADITTREIMDKLIDGVSKLLNSQPIEYNKDVPVEVSSTLLETAVRGNLQEGTPLFIEK